MFKRTAGRSSRFRSNFRSRGPRALGNVKTRITRVQRCQFMLRLDDGQAVGSLTPILSSTNTAFELAKILDHLADFSTDSGVAMAGMVKSIDITRIHFDYGILPSRDIDTGIGEVDRNLWMFHTALCVDRISSAGVPDAVSTTPWFSNQTPTAAIGAGLPTQLEAEQQWPTRVLWERTEALQLGNLRLLNGVEGELYVPGEQQVRLARSGYVSKRLKARITDEQGLYLVFSLGNWTTSNRDAHYSLWAHGAFYYRINF